jgi:hypothetical protein
MSSQKALDASNRFLRWRPPDDYYSLPVSRIVENPKVGSDYIYGIGEDGTGSPILLTINREGRKLVLGQMSAGYNSCVDTRQYQNVFPLGKCELSLSRILGCFKDGGLNPQDPGGRALSGDEVRNPGWETQRL